MLKNKKLAFLILSMALTSCSMCKSNSNFIRKEESAAPISPYLKQTSLKYIINYGPDSYDLVATFDVLFLPKSSSTNGCTAHIHGKYGELVKSEEFSLSGTQQGLKEGEAIKSIASKMKYFITGIINRPDTEQIRERNNRALSIHVEESYVVDYLFK